MRPHIGFGGGNVGMQESLCEMCENHELERVKLSKCETETDPEYNMTVKEYGGT